MLKKLMIRTWFGPLPDWYPEFREHLRHLEKYGWDFLLINEYHWFWNEVKMQLGIQLPDEAQIDRRKAGDWDPYLGAVMQKYLKTGHYDYWAHVNLDAVYGRIDQWLPDSYLCNLDIFGNDPGAICGPFTVYRNAEKINQLFSECPTWRDNLQDPKFRGWDELAFNDTIKRLVLSGQITMGSGFFQSHDHIDYAHKQHRGVYILPDGKLIDPLYNREVMMYHFNQYRKWPVTK